MTKTEILNKITNDDCDHTRVLNLENLASLLSEIIRDQERQKTFTAQLLKDYAKLITMIEKLENTNLRIKSNLIPEKEQNIEQYKKDLREIIKISGNNGFNADYILNVLKNKLK